MDIFLSHYAQELIKNEHGDFRQAWLVDLGYGAEAFTTLECAQRLRKINPALCVLGVEIDPERVVAALPYADALTQFRLGGFNLPLQPGEHVKLIRAFNVLRQYEQEEVPGAYQTLSSFILPGGLIIEGTSDPFGRIWVANLVRKTQDALSAEGLVFCTNFRWGFEPKMFQPVLPKNFIHRMLPGEPIYAFMEAWKEAAHETIGYKEYGLRQWFCASAEALAEKGYSIDTRKKMLKLGFLVWHDPPPFSVS